ncbi:MAG: hypothetical protein JOZ78_09635 [Chroococcidiopsidaceae cyanobacterium CP_BM_ER_R8_30]|nr:hypothetical protein [Chroococcidiopsidaceae cyanobacterium CP_BM_ER_R8_30]
MNKPSNQVPNEKPKNNLDNIFPIVGIGAPAGGLEAFTQLLGEPSNTEDALQIIFSSIQGATGVNFTQYERTILQRRLERRMTLHKLKRLEQYSRYLQEYPTEAIALHNDLLIHTTSFFRDSGAFEAIKRKVFPTIIAKDKSLGSPIRIWVAGCATGEEAYSIAICLLEFLAEQAVNELEPPCDGGSQLDFVKLPVQIYATDVSETEIQTARRGIYSFSQVANVSPERLDQFFVPVEGGYRISKAVRDKCIFARQNLISDPPFSRLDLISCRNVLSFWESSLQKKLLQSFHYGLKPTGFLMLGTSETTFELSNLFASVDNKHKIYSRKTAPTQMSMELITKNSSIAAELGSEVPEDIRSDLELQSLAERTVLNQYAPVGVIIDSNLEILQLRGQISSYLEPAPGKASLNLLKMVKAELRVELRSAIYPGLFHSEQCLEDV